MIRSRGIPLVAGWGRVLAAVILAAAAGCGSIDYVEVESPPGHLRAWRRVDLGPIEVRGKPSDESPEFRRLLPAALRERIDAADLFPGGDPALRLSGRVLRYDPGPPEARSLTVRAGQRSAEVRIEWILEDAATGKRVARFSVYEKTALAFDAPLEALWYRVADRIVTYLRDHR